MRYPASEKLEIIRLVEGSHLPAKRTLDMIGVPRTTFYRWYDRYLSLGASGLEDRPSHPAGSGAGSLTTCASRSSIWPWSSQNCRPGSSLSASPIPDATSCR